MCNRKGRRKRQLEARDEERPALGHLLETEGYRPNPRDFISSAPSVVKRSGLLLMKEGPDGKVSGEFIPT